MTGSYIDYLIQSPQQPSDAGPSLITFKNKERKPGKTRQLIQAYVAKAC